LKAEQKTVYDPVYGAIAADELEWLLIQSPPMQRLKGIKQLGLVDAVFPGANHTRFEHSIGTMHMAGLMARHLGLEPLEVRKVRLAGLLHDLGHSAFSHAVEGVLSRNPDIQPQISEKRVAGHEEFTREIIRRSPFGDRAMACAEETFGNAEGLFSEVAEIAVGHSRPLGQIISGDLDADRVDFLLRDSHHSGVSLGLVDIDQIIQSLTIHGHRVVLAGSDDYRADMSQTAAESILVARAHHYNALIHHPSVQSLRTMLLVALESALESLDPPSARSRIALFFQQDTDHDLLRFVYEKGDDRCRNHLIRIRYGQPFPLAARFDHRTLQPGTRMALSTISRGGRMRKLFEQGLAKRCGALVDISVGSGVPRSIRTETDRFLYDESALAAGLVKSLTRQIALSIFSDSEVEVAPDEIREMAFKLLSFIRAESYLPIDGLLLLFYSLHKLLSESFGERILVPRIRNITWLYRTVSRLRAEGGAGLAGLFDYSFHEDYGFPYSEKLFEDIQILVATGMIFQDMRHFEMGGNWLQRYEYMLSAEGLEYAQGVAGAYSQEAEMVAGYLKEERHSIPYDMTSLLKKRYSGGR
jgi:HD superfamily phosphohydrolase